MNNLYDYLISQEIKRADAESGRLRFLIIGVLLTGFVMEGHEKSAVFCFLFLILNTLYLMKMNRGGAGISPLFLVFLETLLVSAGQILIDRVDITISLTLLYLVILYSASLRLKDSLILFSGILVTLAMNIIYLVHLLKLGDTIQGNPMNWPGFGNQIILTLIVLSFTLTLLSRPHSIKILLNNQQNFLESMNSENYNIFESLDDFCLDFSLSERESEVLSILIRGKTYRMIGTDLFISLDTVKSHIRNIYRKTAADGKSDLIQKLRNYTLARRTLSD